jgi:hypothetical protein
MVLSSSCSTLTKANWRSETSRFTMMPTSFMKCRVLFTPWEHSNLTFTRLATARL